MKLFDLHCDTALEMYKTKQRYGHNTLCIDKKRTAFDDYKQVFAIWSENTLSDDEAYERFFKVTEYLKADRDFPELITDNSLSGTALLSVEGANLLAGDISRLDKLYENGVRLLTLTWDGISVIGGAHGTDKGLTDFGRETVEKCFEKHIIVDTSHLSDKGFDDVAEYKKPFVASHSCLREISDIPRNIDKKRAARLASSGGIIGVNFVGYHLDGNYFECGTTSDAIAKQIKAFLNIVGEDNLAIGADFDGTDKLPSDISGIESMEYLYTKLVSNGIKPRIADKIFFENAYGFFKKNLQEKML